MAAVDATVSSASSGARYAVVVRWPRGATPEGGPLCVCSCPDARPGYCKHAAAVIEHTRPELHQPSWLAAAYKTDGDTVDDDGAGNAAGDSGESDAMRWIKRFRTYEAWLDQRDGPKLRELLGTAIKRDQLCLRITSQMLGGSDAAAESYQTMTATRLFDTRHLIEEASAPRMRWVLLFMLMDSQVAWLQRHVRTALSGTALAATAPPSPPPVTSLVDLQSDDEAVEERPGHTDMEGPIAKRRRKDVPSDTEAEANLARPGYIDSETSSLSAPGPKLPAEDKRAVVDTQEDDEGFCVDDFT
ncbi:Hypothetical Protein FCC1311_002732 [Hondaea fermentalgiana]|uniref:SWIM-type domain-containing protein n=1 Tax=Hondaea fermentalgiana TaxID=2315210 RepID=A0A2R5G0K8_9STRA|nr:Hypothetical Protein FCC1311_002732 [Hondaea fermentalgiana]|eukprot:GBG24055.1 Hypothetical Protein FCC1311_002732 [Hondaea fermentalgiana]